jgi:hypothetical protein
MRSVSGFKPDISISTQTRFSLAGADLTVGALASSVIVLMNFYAKDNDILIPAN